MTKKKIVQILIFAQQNRLKNKEFVVLQNVFYLFKITYFIGYVCDLPLAEGNCGRVQSRFYYDSQTEICLEFLYEGCGGNLNNFLSLSDCQEFCRGTTNFIQNTLFGDDGKVLNDLFVVGFILSGPLKNHTQSFNEYVFLQ